jgi:hypothetical protein
MALPGWGASLAPEPAISAAQGEALCNKLQVVLRSVWVVKIVALVLIVTYFIYLFYLKNEPLLRRTRWEGQVWGNVWVVDTRAEPEWWTTSISEYAAARGTSGAKLLSAAMAVCGALQIVEGSLLGTLCVLSDTGRALLWAGGIGAIVLGQMEASDEYEDSPAMHKLKAWYGVGHAIGALAFVTLSTAGVIISRSGFNWIGGGLAIGGCFCFGIAVLAQNLTGNYAGTPPNCLLPQRPEHRNPAHKRWGMCHRWLNSQRHRIWLSRFVLTAELLGVSLVIFAVTWLSIYVRAAAGGRTVALRDDCHVGGGVRAARCCTH